MIIDEMIAHLWTAFWALAWGSTVASPQLASGSDLERWLETETTIAREGILNNIGSKGDYAASAIPGIVIASPSTENPDCTRARETWSQVSTDARGRLLYMDAGCRLDDESRD